MSTTTYLVKDFATGVNGRRVEFKETLPLTFICSFCGYVSGKLALLPCFHVVCASCFELCAQGDGDDEDAFRCRRDKKPFKTEHVVWSCSQRNQLEKQRVGCWNARYGCDFDGPIAELLEHFEKHCTYHTLKCPCCQETVTRENWPSHYRTKCGAASEPHSDRGGCSDAKMQTYNLESPGVAFRSQYDRLISRFAPPRGFAQDSFAMCSHGELEEVLRVNAKLAQLELFASHHAPLR